MHLYIIYRKRAIAKIQKIGKPEIYHNILPLMFVNLSQLSRDNIKHNQPIQSGIKTNTVSEHTIPFGVTFVKLGTQKCILETNKHVYSIYPFVHIPHSHTVLPALSLHKTTHKRKKVLQMNKSIQTDKNLEKAAFLLLAIIIHYKCYKAGAKNKVIGSRTRRQA